MLRLLTAALFLFLCCHCQECGLKKDVNPLMRIVGGEDSTSTSWPWQALFMTYDKNGVGLMCGASLIADRWLLTAAHCAQFQHVDSFVALGTTSLSDLRDVYAIGALIIHPDYSPFTASNDIALIQTTEKVKLSSLVSPVCVPRDDSLLIRKGTIAYVSGFGVTIDRAESGKRWAMRTSNILMQTSLPIIDERSCARKWSAMTAGTTIITDKQLCAGSLLRGTAPGDSGGPLQVEGLDGHWYIVGITSFGANSEDALLDQGTYPGVYTRVAAYFDWIVESIEVFETSASPSEQLHTKCAIGIVLLTTVLMRF
uniref:Peptidase S1 domain-containing protein n=1 Tax=Parascaris univalens TaxID=6257 RepID=A0A915CD28_PARUN